MACQVLRLETEVECGACGRPVELCRMVVTDQREASFYVVVCRECAPYLDGAARAIVLRDASRRA